LSCFIFYKIIFIFVNYLTDGNFIVDAGKVADFCFNQEEIFLGSRHKTQDSGLLNKETVVNAKGNNRNFHNNNKDALFGGHKLFF